MEGENARVAPLLLPRGHYGRSSGPLYARPPEACQASPGRTLARALRSVVKADVGRHEEPPPLTLGRFLTECEPTLLPLLGVVLVGGSTWLAWSG